MFFLGNIGFWILLVPGIVETNAFTSQPTVQGSWREVGSLFSSRGYTWQFTAQELDIFNSDTAVGANYEYDPIRKVIDFFVEKKENGVITYKVLLLTEQLLVFTYHETCVPDDRMQVWGTWGPEDDEKQKGELIVLLRIRRPTP